MAVKLVPKSWSSSSAYSVGDVVEYNGIRFSCVTAISAGTNPNPIDNSSWEFDGVIRITDYYSLQYAIEFELNTSDETINNSIPAYVQNIERKLSKLLRSPAQRVTRSFTVDADSKFPIPGDMLQVLHLRRDTDSKGYSLRNQGSVSIQKADRTTYEEIRQRYIENGYYIDTYDEYDFPVYYTDEAYFWIAPDYNSGDTFSMTYYQQVPELASTVGLVNDDYQPVNDSDQTLAQWVAEGNDAADFVQAEEVVTSNLWTATAPHLLKAGALVEAYAYLNDADRMAAAQAQYEELLTATEIEFRKFDASGAQSLVQNSAYNY